MAIQSRVAGVIRDCTGGGVACTSIGGMPYPSQPLSIKPLIAVMPNIIVYTRRLCAYCTAAKQLLESRGYQYTEVNLEEHPFALTEEVMRKSGQRTVPQIFVNDQSVGGYRELSLKLSNGDLLA